MQENELDRLLNAARSGTDRDFEELVVYLDQLYQRSATYKVRRRATLDEGEAQDVAQEAWARFLAAWSSGLARSYRAGEVMRILANVFQDRVRERTKRASRQIPFDETDHAARSCQLDGPTTDEIMGRLNALCQDEPMYGVPVRMLSVDGLGAKDIAEQLGLAVNTVYARLRRGRIKLFLDLRERHPEFDWEAFYRWKL